MRRFLLPAIAVLAACGDAGRDRLPSVDSLHRSMDDTVLVVPRAQQRSAVRMVKDSTTKDSTRDIDTTTVRIIDTTWSYTIREFYTKVDTLDTGGGGTPVEMDVGRFGPAAYFNETSPTSPTGVLATFSFAPNENSTRADWVFEDIKEARLRGIPVQLNMPCGSHGGVTKLGNCLRDSSGVAVFSRERFDSALKAILDAPGIDDSLEALYKDGLLSGLNLMDEPWVSGGDDGAGLIVGNTWGPPGTIKRVRGDSLCAEAKKYVDVPVGMSDHPTWDPSGKMKICDFTIPQFSNRFGKIETWRDSMLARAKRENRQVVFSFNHVNGGTQDREGAWDCANQGGQRGSRSPNCSMTPAQLLVAVKALAPYTCTGLMTWKYDANRLSRSGMPEAIKSGLAFVKTLTVERCRVRG